jgi:tyrosine-protein kinase Etk/Wzc
MVVALALLLGAGLGVAVAFARNALDHGVEDPEALERSFGVGVHASVPFSAAQIEGERAGKRGTIIPVLSATTPDDLAVESLRSLRTSLQFALVEARNNVVAIGGPAPGVGKSFVSTNLAHLLGEAGKRVVVVDADLRRGHLHRYYGGERERGLSDVIGGQVALEEALRPAASANVQFVSTGSIPPNPAELLASERFQRVLADLSARFDLVILDLPPILAVTDAAVVGRLAGVNLLVLRAGRHPLREIAAALRALGRAGVRVHGFVLNGVQLDRGLGRKSHYHYQYKY